MTMAGKKKRKDYMEILVRHNCLLECPSLVVCPCHIGKHPSGYFSATQKSNHMVTGAQGTGLQHMW